MTAGFWATTAVVVLVAAPAVAVAVLRRRALAAVSTYLMSVWLGMLLLVSRIRLPAVWADAVSTAATLAVIAGSLGWVIDKVIRSADGNAPDATHGPGGAAATARPAAMLADLLSGPDPRYHLFPSR